MVGGESAADVVTRAILKAVAQTADAGLLGEEAARAAVESMALALLDDALDGLPLDDQWALLRPRAELLRTFVASLAEPVADG